MVVLCQRGAHAQATKDLLDQLPRAPSTVSESRRLFWQPGNAHSIARKIGEVAQGAADIGCQQGVDTLVLQ
jgi:hypothetical protein